MMRFLFLIVIFNTNSKIYCDDFKIIVDSLSHLPSEAFLEQFPYDDYLTNHSLTNVALLEKHRSILHSYDQNGIDFIFQLAEHHINQQPLDFTNIQNIKEQLALGEIMASSQNYLPDSIYLYMAISDLIFGRLADTLEVLIKEKQVEKEDFHIRYFVNRLGDNQYYIDVPTSNATKVIYHIKEGNWDYVYRKATGTYWKTTAMIGGGGILGLIFIIWLYRLFKRRKKTLTND